MIQVTIEKIKGAYLIDEPIKTASNSPTKIAREAIGLMELDIAGQLERLKVGENLLIDVHIGQEERPVVETE